MATFGTTWGYALWPFERYDATHVRPCNDFSLWGKLKLFTRGSANVVQQMHNGFMLARTMCPGRQKGSSISPRCLDAMRRYIDPHYRFDTAWERSLLLTAFK